MTVMALTQWLLRPMLRSRLVSLLLTGDTSILRFWFSLTGLGCAAAIIFDPDYAELHTGAMQLIPSAHAQGLLFLLHASVMLYGAITRRYGTGMLLIEGVLGVALWAGIGLAEAIARQTVGPILIGGLIAFFLLMRYPTHYEGGPDGD